jgi:hypothetical protein
MSDSNWTSDDQVRTLKEEIRAIITQKRTEQLEKLLHTITKTLDVDIVDLLKEQLSKPFDTLWERVNSSFQALLAREEDSYSSKVKSFRVSPNEEENGKLNIRAAALSQLVNSLQNETSDQSLFFLLRSEFEKCFRYDESGIPRVWAPGDDIDSAYRTAKKAADSVLSTFSSISLPFVNSLEPDATLCDNESEATKVLELIRTLSKPLVPKSKAEPILTRFRLEADAVYTDAKRSLVQLKTEIPRWVLPILLVLGWNEIIYLLSSPLMLFLVLLVTAAAFLLHQTGLLRPTMVAGTRATREVARQVGKQISDYQGGKSISNSLTDIAMATLGRNKTSPSDATSQVSLHSESSEDSTNSN